MSDATIVTIVSAVLGAIPATIVAWAALKQGQKNEAKATETAIKVEAAAKDTTQKLEAVHTQTQIIEKQGNSAATAAAMKIEALQKELILMRESMADKKEIAALLAQAAVRPSVRPPRATDPALGAGGSQPVSLDEPIKVEVVNTPLETTATESKEEP